MIRISKGELKRRVEKLGKLMSEKDLDAIYISGTTSFKYFADYFYIATERPAAFLIDKNLDIHFFGPVMEKEHVLGQCPNIKDSYGYPDYPGDKHPLKYFGEWTKNIVKEKKIGVDNPSFYSSGWGFKPIPVDEIVKGFTILSISEDLYNMRKIKSDEEIEIMRESSKWGNLAHNLLQEYIEPGKFDFEISYKASSEANKMAMYAFGMDTRPSINSPMEIGAGFRGRLENIPITHIPYLQIGKSERVISSVLEPVGKLMVIILKSREIYSWESQMKGQGGSTSLQWKCKRSQ